MGGSGGEEQFQRRKGSSVMKSLVVYSSKSGNTKRVAEAVARGLGEDTVLVEYEAPAQGAKTGLLGRVLDKIGF